METGIIFERSAARPFAVSLANTQQTGLPEHIRRDDIEALREEWDAVVDEAFAKVEAIKAEIRIRLAQAQKAGFNTEGW